MGASEGAFAGNISIHALRKESDVLDGSKSSIEEVSFLSTLSARRATLDELCRMMGIKHFYPRSPQGERPLLLMAHPVGRKISIHALRKESDASQLKPPIKSHRFLSTLSARRATTRLYSTLCCDSISIHALRKESDLRKGPRCQGLSEFLSTLSARRATH